MCCTNLTLLILPIYFDSNELSAYYIRCVYLCALQNAFAKDSNTMNPESDLVPFCLQYRLKN